MGPRAQHHAGAVGHWALLALLAACSSCQPSTPVPDPTEPAAQSTPAGARNHDPRPVLAAFGDSLTAGHQLAGAESYPDYLQRELDGRGLAFRVVNEGIGGDTTAKGLSRINSVLAHQPRWVILALGANDGLRGLAIDSMEANLREIIQRLQERRVNVVLAGMKLPRNYGPEYVQAFEAVYPRLAQELDVPLIPFLLENVAMQRDLNHHDGIHPNAKGNQIIARQVADAFEAFVQD